MATSMTTAGTDAYNVYLGFWTNWSHGKVAGSTLTISKQNAGLLIAFIAIYVGATGKSFWRLVCFLLHRHFSALTPQDAVYHQRQAILRNVGTAQDAAWTLGNAMLMWRGRSRRPLRRLLPVIVLALVVSVSFGVAGVFSSQITTDGANEVLVRGDNCGPLDSSDTTLPIDYSTLFLPFQGARATSYNNYALRCYRADSTAEDCNLYIKSHLPTIVNTDAPCPFSPEMCKFPTKGNIKVDSGLLDSHADLGINSPPEHRFQYRIVHECAPLVTNGFAKQYTPNSTNGPLMRYYYGPLNRKNATFTYQMPLNDSVSSAEGYNYRSSAMVDYKLGMLKSYIGAPEMAAGNSDFFPIAQLNRSDADVMLFFLSSQGIDFVEQTNDPWYSAHQPGVSRVNSISGHVSTSYRADELVSVLGCTNNLQLCNPNRRGPDGGPLCNPLHGMADFTFDRYALWEDPARQLYMKWIDNNIGLGLFTISGIVSALGSASLTARYMVQGARQGPLPDDQWQREVRHWVGASLTSIQGALVEAANGPPRGMEAFRVVPNETVEWEACNNQKIISTRYASFSVLGVSLILCIGGLIMALDFGLEPLLAWLDGRNYRRYPHDARKEEVSSLKRAFARLEWRANATLQLQRMAHEHAGRGTWSNAAGANPVTLSNETLAVLDVTNEQHPLLRAPSPVGDEKPKTTPSRAGTGCSTETTVSTIERFDFEKDLEKGWLSTEPQLMKEVDLVMQRQGEDRSKAT